MSIRAKVTKQLEQAAINPKKLKAGSVVAKQIKAGSHAAVVLSGKETASVETAKKHKSTSKMVSKIAAIIQSMGMDEGQWDAVSKQVFKKAFGGKREKAAVEIANVKQAQSIVSLTKRFDKGIKLPKGDDDMWPEKTVKAHLNDPDMKGEYAPITVKGESDDHFWVKTKGDDEIMGAVYKKDNKWYAFMGTSAMCVGAYSTKDLAAGAVVLDYNG